MSRLPQFDDTQLASRIGHYGRRAKAIAALSAAIAIGMPQAAQAGGTVDPGFNPADFSNPLIINNPYFPLVPGTVYTYFAEGEDGCEVNIFAVLDMTRNVAGVTSRVVSDVAFEDEDCNGPTDDEIVERTNDWFAQDNSGNVWYMGEYSEDCEGGDNCELSDGSWEAGVDGAIAGIQMLATPLPGTRYYQEYYEDHAEDQALVMRTNANVEFDESELFEDGLQNCLVTKEWSALEPGAIEHKFYCPGIGLVAVDEHHGKTLHVELTQMAP